MAKINYIEVNQFFIKTYGSKNGIPQSFVMWPPLVMKFYNSLSAYVIREVNYIFRIKSSTTHTLVYK